MDPVCRYLSETPISYDVFKSPTLRWNCRNPKRIKVKEPYSQRFVGNGPDDCDQCPYYESSCKADESIIY